MFAVIVILQLFRGFFPPPPTQRDMAKYIYTDNSHDSWECIWYQRLHWKLQRSMAVEGRLVKIYSPFPHNIVSMEYFHFRELIKTSILFHKA